MISNNFYARVHELYKAYNDQLDEDDRIAWEDLDQKAQVGWFAVAGDEYRRLDAYKEEWRAKMVDLEFKITSRYRKRERDLEACLRAAKHIAEQAWSALLSPMRDRRQTKKDVAELLQGLEWMDDANFDYTR